MVSVRAGARVSPTMANDRYVLIYSITGSALRRESDVRLVTSLNGLSTVTTPLLAHALICISIYACAYTRIHSRAVNRSIALYGVIAESELATTARQPVAAVVAESFFLPP